MILYLNFNKMKKNVSIAIILLFTLPLISQNIKFKDFKPKWIHSTNTTISEPIRSKRTKDYIVDNDDFFLLSSLISKGYEGYLLEKINLKTGVLKWKSDYFSTKIGKKEYASNIILDESKTIKLLTIRNSKAEGKFWSYGWIEQRNFDSESGIIKDSTIREDGYLVTIPTGFAQKKISLSLQNNDVHFSSLEMNHLFYFFTKKIISEDGNLISTDENRSLLNFDFGNHNSMDYYVLEDNSKYSLRHQTKQNSIDTFKLDFLHISQDLDSLIAFELTLEVDAADKFEIMDASNDFFLVRSSKKIYNGKYLFDRLVYYLFNMNGVLLEKSILENLEGNNKFDKGVAKKLVGEDRISVIYSDESNAYQELIFSETDGDGNFIIIGNVQSSNFMDRFTCQESILIGGDYLLNLRYTDQRNDDPYIESSIWLRCNKEDLSTTINEFEKNDTKFLIYPNPNDGYIRINNFSNEKPSFIIIRDVLGNELKNIFYQKNIQLSTLPNGIYWIEIFNNQNRKLWTQKIIQL